MTAKRPTLTNRVDALEAALTRIEAGVEALVASNAPAKRTAAPKATERKATKPAAKKSARKAPAKKAAKAPKATTRCLTRANRKEFVAAHAWAAGLGTGEIARRVLQDGAPLAKGWAIGARRAEMIAAKSA